MVAVIVVYLLTYFPQQPEILTISLSKRESTVTAACVEPANQDDAAGKYQTLCYVRLV